MNVDSSLEDLTTAVDMEQVQRHWRLREEGPARAAVAPPLAIALSRETGTPGSRVALALGQRLGWQVYDHELLEKIAQEMGLRTRLLESVDERHINWMREAVREIMQAVSDVPSVSESEYARHLLETMLSLSTHGRCVIVGRGAAQVLPPSSTLRVRLVAPPEARVAVIAQKKGVNEREARRWVQQHDRERDLFIRNNFRKDPEDCQHYDLVLNSSRWSIPQCVELIVDALRHLQERTDANGAGHLAAQTSDLYAI
jgi:cytidylate kinase